jgi:hypothetical protein
MPGSDPKARADQSPTKSGESGAEMGLGSAQQAGDGAEMGLVSAQQAGDGAEPPRPGLVDWLLVAFVTLLCALTALVGVAFLPWHIGAVPMPVSALLGIGAMILAPRACFRLTGSLLAAALPVVTWFVVTVWLVLLRNPMMLSQAVSVVNGQWRVMVLLGLGSLAAAATLTLLWAERTQAHYAGTDGDRAAEGAEADEPPVRST